MTTRRIFALGGGFSLDDSTMDDLVQNAIRVKNPKVCFIGTASGDSAWYYGRFKNAWEKRGVTPTRLSLTERVADLAGFVADQDAFYVGGGNTANMLALWRLHELDDMLRRKYDTGTVFAGISAGVNVWHDASTTDSFGDMDALGDGLGWLPGSACPHYNTEEKRRPFYLDQVARGVMPGGIAIDDGAGCLFEDEDISDVFVNTTDVAVYRVSSRDGRSVEEALPARLLP